MENRAKNIGFKAFVIHLDKEPVLEPGPRLGPEIRTNYFSILLKLMTLALTRPWSNYNFAHSFSCSPGPSLVLGFN